jgi:hypothetical protein
MVKRSHRLVVLLTLLLGLGASLPASAERIASKADEPRATRAADLGRVSDAAGQGEVRQALGALGLQPSEVDARLAQLSDEDLRRLAANVDQVQAAGAVPQYIWILLAIFLAVSIIVMIV